MLDQCGITTNKNTVPGDPNGPFVTSGIRIGTAAATSRGYRQGGVYSDCEAITAVLDNPACMCADKAKSIVRELGLAHPLYR